MWFSQSVDSHETKENGADQKKSVEQYTYTNFCKITEDGLEETKEKISETNSEKDEVFIKNDDDDDDVRYYFNEVQNQRILDFKIYSI